MCIEDARDYIHRSIDPRQRGKPSCDNMSSFTLISVNTSRRECEVSLDTDINTGRVFPSYSLLP